MKPLFLALFFLATVSSLRATPDPTIALVGGTVINPRDGQVIPNAIISIEADQITAVGPRTEATRLENAEVIDCAGKFILPGYIDTHVHFFQSGGLFTRPDAVDLTERPALQRRGRDDRSRNLPGHFRALSALRHYQRRRCRWADVEFRGA